MTTENGFEKLFRPEPGCWINAIAPTREERVYLEEVVGVLPEFIKSSLDEEENAHVDYDDDRNQTLIIVDYPYYDEQEKTYSTLPLGVAIFSGYIVTIGLYENADINAMLAGNKKDIDTHFKTRLLFQLMLRISQRYVIYLRQIDRLSTQIENRLLDSMSNDELLNMLDLEKSLVYFSTSLKGDELTLGRIRRGRYIKLYEDDVDLLEDVIIEFDQATEMCKTYKDVINETMDTFSNVISNNLNVLMKKLTIVTIAMEVPNMVYGFYGMNVVGLPIAVSWFPFIFSIVAAMLVWQIFRKVE